jgi:predicted regulator of Ras-like GTPase activity (Roadblock/LC7/MglB family)
MNFQESLSRTIGSIPGAMALSLIGLDGLRVAGVVNNDAVDMDNLSAELTTFIRNLNLANADLKLGRLQQIALISQSYTSIISSITDEYYLLCVMDHQEYFGEARYQLRKLALRLREEL